MTEHFRFGSTSEINLISIVGANNYHLDGKVYLTLRWPMHWVILVSNEQLWG